jgi:tetratricopeptide (TPR) repeat protein
MKHTFTRWYSQHMKRGNQFLRLVSPVSLSFQQVRRPLLAAFCFVLLHTFALASQSKPNSGCALARPYISGAETALTVGDSASAREKLKRAIQVSPQCAEAHLRLGLIEFQTGAVAESIPHYQQALKLQPSSYSARYNLALAYLRQQKFREARTQLEKAVSLDPRQPDAAYDLGITLLELGEPKTALVHLLHAGKLTPARPDVAFNIVRAELEAGKFTEARTAAQLSAKRFGSDFQWVAAIGQLFMKNAQPAEAAVYLQQARALRPDSAELSRQLAMAYLKSGQPDQVLSAIPDPKTPDDHYLRASAYYIAHRFSEADSESDVAMSLAPENPQILALRTRLLQRAGLQDDAFRLAQRVISLAPQWDEPYYLAGVSAYFIRRYAEAEQNLARAVQLNPKSSQALFLQSIALGNLGKIDDAELALRRAIKLQPANARLHCHLGILLMRRSESAEAKSSFRKSIQLKPDYALPHYELGKLLVSEQQLPTAAHELEQAIAHDPGLTAAYYQLARAYAKLGQRDKSDRLLREFKKLSQQEAQDSRGDDQALEQDTRNATESP